MSSQFKPINASSSSDSFSSVISSTASILESSDNDNDSSNDQSVVVSVAPSFGRAPAVRFDQADDMDELKKYWKSVAHIGGPLLDFHRLMLGMMEFEVLGGAGANRYIRWRITSIDFWKNSPCRPHYRDIALSRSIDQPIVHVDIRGGSPVGEYIAKILTDSRRIRGLVAQAFGYPNEAPCKLCEEHFRSSDSENRAGMWPFFGCHTLPGEDDCGNCLYIMTKCNLRAPELKFLRARADRVPPIREDVTEESSPAINKYNGRKLARKILS